MPSELTVAMSSRSDFQSTRTGAATAPSSRRARGETRTYSDGMKKIDGGSMRSAAAVPLPAGWPQKGSDEAGPVVCVVVVTGGVCDCVGRSIGVGAGPPTTCTAAVPERVPTRAEMMTTPDAIPVTVPLLSTFATATLLDVHEIRTVGMTLPLRSNAVAMSPERSPTLTVTDGGATCTSA